MTTPGGDGADGPLVSVIVPAHNAAEYIDQCVGSVLEQTFGSLQILVVDDASTDDTAARVAAWDDRRICLISLSENRGLSGARNAGLENASGDWITFLDADDWLEPQAVQVALDAARAHSADLVLWSYLREFGKESLPRPLCPVLGSRPSPVVLDGDDVQQTLLRRLVGPLGEEVRDPGSMDSLVTAWGKLYRASVIRDVTFSEVIWEDGIFNIEAFGRSRRAVVLDDLLLHYRKVGSSSLSRRARSDQIERRTESLEIVRHRIAGREPALEWTQAWNNRVALSVLGIALKVATTNDSLRRQTMILRQAVSSYPYAHALEVLDVAPMPAQWRIFFTLARGQRAAALMLAARIIDRYLSR